MACHFSRLSLLFLFFLKKEGQVSSVRKRFYYLILNKMSRLAGGQSGFVSSVLSPESEVFAFRYLPHRTRSGLKPLCCITLACRLFSKISWLSGNDAKCSMPKGGEPPSLLQ